MQTQTDYELMEASLERAAEVCDDLTPLVYGRFFDAHPEARTLFHMGERTRGRMLNEILAILLELAQGHDYMPATVRELAKDHTSYGEISDGYYRGLLNALTGVLADQLGSDWTSARERAWRVQAERLMELVAQGVALCGGQTRASVTPSQPANP